MADSKVSALTELAVQPADTDEFYINDGGVSKRITSLTMRTSIVLVTPALGTPSSGVITACTGAPTLAITNMTGTGTNLTFVNPALGTPASGVATNLTGAPTFTLAKRSVAAGVTAAVGSAQGDGPITTDIVQISTCANAGDAVTLPSAAAGLQITIVNKGAQACDVFPASGDNLGAGANTAASLAATANITYIAYDATNWFAKT